jgi:hypothetical protein
MNRNALLSITATLPLLFAPSVGRCGPDGLEGRWKIVEVPEGWKKVPGTSVIISSGVIRINLGKVTTAQISYTIDPATGKVDTVRKVKGKDVVQHGIYRHEGDTLTLSVGAEGRPAPSTPDSTGKGAMRWVFRKAS